MEEIPLNTVEGSWTFLNRFPQEKIDELFDLFRREQPVLYEYVLTQNREGFRSQKEGALILRIAFFIWSVFRGEKHGKLPTVTNELLSKILKERTGRPALLQNESELDARNARPGARTKHPQFNLLTFVYETVEDDGRTGVILTPTTIKSAYHDLNVVILALDNISEP